MAYANRFYLRLYLNVWPGVLAQLDDSQAGQIFQAMVEYAAGGAVPEFADEQLAAVWPYVKASVDRDLATCEAKQRRAKARRAARERKSNG